MLSKWWLCEKKRPFYLCFKDILIVYLFKCNTHATLNRIYKVKNYKIGIKLSVLIKIVFFFSYKNY